MAHLQASKIERVCDASRSDGGRVDVVDCDPFPTGELHLDCETGGSCIPPKSFGALNRLE